MTLADINYTWMKRNNEMPTVECGVLWHWDIYVIFISLAKTSFNWLNLKKKKIPVTLQLDYNKHQSTPKMCGAMSPSFPFQYKMLTA